MDGEAIGGVFQVYQVLQSSPDDRLFVVGREDDMDEREIGGQRPEVRGRRSTTKQTCTYSEKQGVPDPRIAQNDDGHEKSDKSYRHKFLLIQENWRNFNAGVQRS
jgi:hypothetical protein